MTDENRVADPTDREQLFEDAICDLLMEARTIRPVSERQVERLLEQFQELRTYVAGRDRAIQAAAAMAEIAWFLQQPCPMPEDYVALSAA